MKKQVIIYIILVVAILLFVQGEKKDKVSVADTNVKAAEAEVDVWDGTADTSWYEEVQVRNKVWTITTPEQLAGVAKLVNEEGVTFEGQTIQLANDIYLNEDWENYRNWGSEPPANEWEPIGEWWSYEEIGCFCGDFKSVDEENGCKIYGLYVDNENDYQGLFAKVTSADISGIHIRDSYICGKSRVGSLVGFSYEGVNYQDCSSNALVVGDTASGSAIGGLVGFSNASTELYGCYNLGDVSGTYNVGGIVGRANADIWYSYNEGQIIGNTYVGGLTGGPMSRFSTS